MPHECEEWLSVCCGKEANEYVEEFCGACGEATGFECIECERPKEFQNDYQCRTSDNT